MAHRLEVGLLSVGFGLLVLAWVFATPPYRAPDEGSHYLRAASIANGSLLGPRAAIKGGTPAQTAWLNHNTRAQSVDARLVPSGWSCIDRARAAAKGRCVVANYSGNYQPLPYLLPAIAVRFANHASRGVWLGRIASALQCLGFVVLAFALLWRGTAWSVVGLLAALTPTTLFMTSVINPDGLELAANLAFVAGLLRLSGPRLKAPVWVWPAIALSGSVEVLAWQLGWLFVSVELTLVALLLGKDQLRTLIRENRGRAAATALVISAALALYLAWSVGAGLLHGDFGVSPLGPGLQAGLSQLRVMAYGAVGLFGLLDVALPADGYYWVWWILVLVLMLAAMALAKPRERVVAVLGAAIALAFPVLLYAWVFRHTGFGLAPRYVMPLVALIPLLSGELVFRAYDRLPVGLVRYAPYPALVLIACYQLMAWWINARVSAGEPTAVWFAGSPHWSPPRGWIPWMTAAALGTLVLIGLAFRGAFDARRASVSTATPSEPQTHRPVNSAT